MMQLRKVSERSSSIRITFIWIRFWPPRIARRAISTTRSRFTREPKTQRICRVAALLSPIPAWAGKRRREAFFQLVQAKRYVSAPLIALFPVALVTKKTLSVADRAYADQ
jgi:hypothetical protein